MAKQEDMKDAVVEFLKEYVDELNGASILPFLPLSSRALMAQGAVVALDKNGNTVAFFQCDHHPDGSETEYDCSMPVNGFQFQFCKLFVDLVNSYGEAMKEKA
jgi:hypothetical protein